MKFFSDHSLAVATAILFFFSCLSSAQPPIAAHVPRCPCASLGYTCVSQFGAPNGVDDTAAFERAASTGKPVFVPTGLYHVDGADLGGISALVGTDRGSVTIRHKDGATGYALHLSGEVRVSGITFDGNKTNQTQRPDILRFNGDSLVVQRCDFRNTVAAGVRVVNAMETIRIEECRFSDMAEHGGKAGETSYALHMNSSTDVRVWLVDNEVTHDTVVNPNRVPGGFILSGTAISVSVTGNYFRNIGQREAGNYVGNIDLYTDCDRTIIRGNRFENYYYIPMKLSNSGEVICESNLVIGAADASANQAISLQNSRNFDSDLDNWIVRGNVVSLSGKNDGIVIQGSPTHFSHRAVVASNVIENPIAGIAIRWATDVSCSDNVIRNPDSYAVWVRDTDNISGIDAPERAFVKISGGIFGNCGIVAVFARDNVTNLHLSVDDVTFEDNETYHITARDAKWLSVTSCEFAGDPVNIIDVRVESLLLVGNLAVPESVVVSTSIGRLIDQGNSWQ